ncbi:MAG: 2Fe-2S iron-sulfur cluster-binding protein [Burkholderiales bacterium]
MRIAGRTLSRRDLRLASGLVLYAYIAAHLGVHALALWSIDVAETALAAMVRWWHSAPGSALFYGAAAVHVSLALWSVWQRRTLRMPPADFVRILLGVGIPLLLIGHAIGTRYAWEAHRLAPVYTRIVHALWASDSEGRQLALLVPGWLHGCLGVWFAFRHHAWVERAKLALFAFALLVPLLAGLAFVDMGREFARLALDPAWVAANAMPAPAAVRQDIARWRDTLVLAWVVLVAAVFTGRWFRQWVEQRTGRAIAIDYPGRRVQVPRGWSVLEASRGHGIAHASVCGGRARCSTCRIRVTAGLDHCAVPDEDEARTLARVGAAPDVRLACQLRPTGAVAVVPLVAPPATADIIERAVERRVVVLVATMAVRPTGSRPPLPHDALYAMNETAEAVGEAVLESRGEIVEFNGQGVLAVFGAQDSVPEAAERALDAAARIGARLDALDRRLADAAGAVAGIAVGLHAGSVVQGEIGFHGARSRAIVGRTVEEARRLAQSAHGAGRRYAMSANFADGVDTTRFGDPVVAIEVPGLGAAARATDTLRPRPRDPAS